MPSAELTSTRARQEPAADGVASAQPPAEHSRGRAVFRAVASWLWRVLANSAGAWALAAGALPPDLYD